MAHLIRGIKLMIRGSALESWSVARSRSREEQIKIEVK